MSVVCNKVSNFNEWTGARTKQNIQHIFNVSQLQTHSQKQYDDSHEYEEAKKKHITE